MFWESKIVNSWTLSNTNNTVPYLAYSKVSFRHSRSAVCPVMPKSELPIIPGLHCTYLSRSVGENGTRWTEPSFARFRVKFYTLTNYFRMFFNIYVGKFRKILRQTANDWTQSKMRVQLNVSTMKSYGSHKSNQSWLCESLTMNKDGMCEILFA